MIQARKHTLNTLAESVSHLFVPGPVLLLWLPLGLAGRTHGSSRLVAQGAGCQSTRSDCGTWRRPRRTRGTGGGPTLAQAGPPMVAGRLGAPMMPHPSLVLGAGALGLGLGGSRASLLRSLPVSPGQVSQRYVCCPGLLGGSFPCFSLAGEHGSSLDPDLEVWRFLSVICLY